MDPSRNTAHVSPFAAGHLVRLNFGAAGSLFPFSARFVVDAVLPQLVGNDGEPCSGNVTTWAATTGLLLPAA